MKPIAPTSTKEDILQYLLKHKQSSAQQLSETLAISPQAIRRHLKDLEEEALVCHDSVIIGMGRPQHMYSLSPTGKKHFPKQYDQFSVNLLDTLTATLGIENVQSILRQQWLNKSKLYRSILENLPLPDRLEKLAEIRRSEGYEAEWYVHPDQEGYFFTESNCVIAEVASSFPNVCAHELEMFIDLLPDCNVERTHWMIDGEHRCGYRIVAKLTIGTA